MAVFVPLRVFWGIFSVHHTNADFLRSKVASYNANTVTKP